MLAKPQSDCRRQQLQPNPCVVLATTATARHHRTLNNPAQTHLVTERAVRHPRALGLRRSDSSHFECLFPLRLCVMCRRQWMCRGLAQQCRRGRSRWKVVVSRRTTKVSSFTRCMVAILVPPKEMGESPPAGRVVICRLAHADCASYLSRRMVRSNAYMVQMSVYKSTHNPKSNTAATARLFCDDRAVCSI